MSTPTSKRRTSSATAAREHTSPNSASLLEGGTSHVRDGQRTVPPRREKNAIPDRDELLARLDEASLNGSVTATKLLLEELRRDSDDHAEPGSTLDALDNVTPIRKSA